MKKKKIIFICIFMFAIFYYCFTTFSIAYNNNVNGTYDYNEGTSMSLNAEFQYGTLFWREKTGITEATDYTTLSNGAYQFRATRSKEIKFTLTNCAIDKDHNMCDVEIKVYNVTSFQHDTNCPDDRKNAAYLTVGKYTDDSLVQFNLAAYNVSANFQMTYYKAGTKEKANIPYVVATVDDFDCPAELYAGAGDFNDELFGGNEGIAIPKGQIYYDKKREGKDVAYNKGYLVEDNRKHGGIGVRTVSTAMPTDNFTGTWVNSEEGNGFTRRTSATVMEPSSDTYSYRMLYGGRYCGIDFKFISPYPYTLENSIKKANNTEVYEEEEFIYTISQYVPNSYYINDLKGELGIENTRNRYTSYVIQDELNENLIANKDNITIINESGKDVRDYFDISIDSDNLMQASVKEGYLNDPEFYAHLYNINIPVSIKEGTGINTGKIQNQAKTIARTPSYLSRSSNTIEVGLKYRCYYTSKIDNGNTWFESDRKGKNATYTENDIPHNSTKYKQVFFKLDPGYTIVDLKIDGESVSMDQLGKDEDVYFYTFMDENIVQNVSHKIEVKTQREATSVIVRYVDEKGNEIADSEEINGNVSDSYETNAKEISGYKLKATPENATGQMTAEPITVTYVYQHYNASIEVSKRDNNTGKIITKEDTIFALYEWQASTNTWVKPTHINTSTISGTVSDGKGARLKEKTSGTKGTYSASMYYDLQNQGKFKIVEYTRPWGYTTTNWSKEFQITQDTQRFSYSSEVKNTQVRGQINFKKNDKQVNYKNESYAENYAQGDASLQGAVYGLYAKENILSPDTGTILYSAGQQMMTGTTDANGKIVWSNLYLGKYYIQEITPSIGYLKDTTQYEVDLKTYYHDNYYSRGDQTTRNIIYQNVTTDTLYQNSEKRIISKEMIQKQSFQLTKLVLSDDSTMANPLQGAGFKIYLIKDLSKIKDGTLQADANGNYNITDLKKIDFTKEQTALDFASNSNGTRIPELFSDEDGVVISPELAYGKYVVIESTVPDGLQVIEPFIVDIYEDSRKPKKMVYPVDREFEARIKVVKKDDTTGKTVLKADASYRIWDITQKKYVEQWVTYPNKVQYGTESNPYRTTEEGYLLTPDRLGMGEYELREVKAPEGYVIAGKEENPKSNVRFSINTNVVYEIDPDLGAKSAVITVEQRNTPQVGTITVSKKGEFLSGSQEQENGYQFEYKQRAVTDAKFAIYAKDDVYTQDNQTDENGERTKIYVKNQFIKEVGTNQEGKAIFEKLPLGQYIIVEQKAGEGFTLNTERKEVPLTYEGQDKAVIYKNTEYINERQKIQISIHKTDREENVSLQGVKFGLYTKEAIHYIDNAGNNQTIPTGKLIAVAVTGKDGKANFQDENLPLGKYNIRELKAKNGYIMSSETIDMDCSYVGQEIDKIAKEIEFNNTKTKLRIRVTDNETGENLIGTQIVVRDENNNKIGTYTIDEKGIIEVKGLEVGKQYSIEEVKQRNGYTKDILYKNTTSDQNELIKAKDGNGFIIFQIKDKQEMQTVTISNKAKVGHLRIQKTGEVLVGQDKDKNGNVIFHYETKNIDTAKFEIYAKEDIVHPDGKQGTILAKGEKIGEGQTKNGVMSINKFSEELIQAQPQIVQLLLNRGLPLGEYEIRETESPQGYQKENQVKTIKLEFHNDNNEVETASTTIHNIRQSTNIGKPSSSMNPEENDIGIYKTDAETDKPIPGTIFGLYAAEDIIGLDNTVLVEKDTLIEKATTNQDGYAKFTSDLPISKYYILEIKPATGYISNQERIEIDATSISSSEKEYIVKMKVQNKKTEINVVKIEKTDDLMNMIPIEGAKLQIIEENGNVVKEWNTEKNVQIIKGLETEKQYLLHEEQPAKGYVTTKDIEFSLNTDGSLKIEEAYTNKEVEIPNIIMQDDMTRVEIAVVDKETKQPIKDIVVQLKDKTTGEIVYEFTTDGKKHKIERIPIGNYEILEKNLSNGYVSTDTKEFRVDDTSEWQKKVLEHDYTRLDIQFVDELTKDLLSGGKLEVRNDKDEVVATINDTGVHYYVERLPAGNYTIIEVEVPEGYERIQDVTFTLGDSPDVKYIKIENKRLPFDFRVEKYASEVFINGVKQAGTGKPGEVVKIDINGKEINIQNIEVVYTIKIINSGEVAGTVGKVIDKVPSGLKFDANKNEDYWKKEGKNITTTLLANQKLQPGETVELKILLDWTKSEFNLGEKVNVAMIDEVKSSIGFEEQDSNNNSSSYTMEGTLNNVGVKEPDASNHDSDFVRGGTINHVGFEEKDVNNNNSSSSVVISLKTGREIVLIKQIIIIILGIMAIISVMVFIKVKIMNPLKA